MFSLIEFEPREYQESIVKTCLEKNTLVVLPTGVGKTAIALMLGINRLNKFPESKIVICSPTKPLCQQHVETFKNHTNIPSSRIFLYTGASSPAQRKKLWDLSLVIVATPQTIQSDLENKRIFLTDVSLLVIDEAHRSRMKYATTIVAKEYNESKSLMKRILALTASPGHTKEKVREVCDHLFIEDIEIRSDSDLDVKSYVQEKTLDIIELELPPVLNDIHGLFRAVYRDCVKELSHLGFNKPVSVVNKKDLLLLQKRFIIEAKRKQSSAFYGMSLVARAIKLDFAAELLETQGALQSLEYLNNLESESSKAAKSILSNETVKGAKKMLEEFVNDGLLHPKMVRFSQIVSEQLTNNPKTKIMVFANYRSTVEQLSKIVAQIPNAKPVMLMGQKDGITQKMQLETISDFEKGKYNVLIATSIGEEGLSIGSLDLAIFYDHVASAIRRIQRAGRVARIKPGRVVYLITKNTRDAAFFWKSRRDETTMGTVLSKMKDSLLKK